jgi:hypothetical protein
MTETMQWRLQQQSISFRCVLKTLYLRGYVGTPTAACFSSPIAISIALFVDRIRLSRILRTLPDYQPSRGMSSQEHGAWQWPNGRGLFPPQAVLPMTGRCGPVLAFEATDRVHNFPLFRFG